jgi:hypothetical protein
MRRPDEYRRFAAECLKMANDTESEQAHAIFLQMAQVWLRLADEKIDAGSRREDETI